MQEQKVEVSPDPVANLLQKSLEKNPKLEDPFLCLPHTGIKGYEKGRIIFAPDDAATSLYLIVEGKVKILRPAENENGDLVVMGICSEGEFFGEISFVYPQSCEQQAVALGPVRLMSWPFEKVREAALKRPELAVVLIQILTQRAIDFENRIVSFSTDNIVRRLARALVCLSKKLVIAEEDDGSVRMAPLTHEFLSQYIGTSREIVTFYMNQFRRQGYLRYSRKGVILYLDALQEWLKQRAV